MEKTPSSISKNKVKKTTNQLFGGVAQLGEHLPCKQGVMGSNPIISTTDTKVSERKPETGDRESP